MAPADESTVGDLLAAARTSLAATSFEAPPREAALLLGHVLDLSEAQIIARRDVAVADADRARFESLLARRLRGEPMAYLFGSREFYGRDFHVDRRVLIPRPETEHLIEAALDLDLPSQPRIVDVGTGSGAIAITLCCEIPDARVVAIDREVDALQVAKANGDRHDARVGLLQTDVLDGIDLDGIDLLVSNPPYVAPDALPTLSPEVHAFEPHAALFARDEGRSVIRRLLDAAEGLRPGTPTLLEIGYDQGDWLRQAVESRSALRLEQLICDYSGIERIARLCSIG